MAPMTPLEATIRAEAGWYWCAGSIAKLYTSGPAHPLWRMTDVKNVASQAEAYASIDAMADMADPSAAAPKGVPAAVVEGDMAEVWAATTQLETRDPTRDWQAALPTYEGVVV